MGKKTAAVDLISRSQTHMAGSPIGHGSTRSRGLGLATRDIDR